MWVFFDGIICKSKCNKRIIFNSEYCVISLVVDFRIFMRKVEVFLGVKKKIRYWLEGRELNFLVLMRIEIGKCYYYVYNIF